MAKSPKLLKKQYLREEVAKKGNTHVGKELLKERMQIRQQERVQKCLTIVVALKKMYAMAQFVQSHKDLMTAEKGSLTRY